MLIDLIRERGPMTVAAFMDLALYHPQFGYYARAPKRSGRAGDFFTSVDVGALFGELLAMQIAEMCALLDGDRASTRTRLEDPTSPRSWDLVEAGAGNGQLSTDILRAIRTHRTDLYDRLRLHLVEASASARATQRSTLAENTGRLASASAELPDSFEGVLVANELLDALPVHQVVMRHEGLREIYVEAAERRTTNQNTMAGPEHKERGTALSLREGPLSTTALAEYLAHLDVTLEPGWRVEINLNAAAWIRDVARRLVRGFIILIDYGHEARELYSVTHAGGTLTSFAKHTAAGAESSRIDPPWLDRPGEQDITAHVDFTTVRESAEAGGLVTLGLLDQTYFLLGLADLSSLGSQGSPGSNLENPENVENLKRRLAFKTLLLPGGLGSTMKVLILGKGVGTPALRGCSFRMRMT